MAISWHYVAPGGDYPLALQLYLPESWTSAPRAAGRAGPDAGPMRTVALADVLASGP